MRLDASPLNTIFYLARSVFRRIFFPVSSDWQLLSVNGTNLSLRGENDCLVSFAQASALSQDGS